MRKIVFDITDLQAISPVFKSRILAWFGRKLIKWLDFEKVNIIHSNHCHYQGAEFTSAILADSMMDVKYNIHNMERLDSLPEGAFITVSNHPIGSLDGIILIDIFASRRNDYRVMVNEMLMKISALANSFISVQPSIGDNIKGNLSNTGGVRACISRLREKHPIGFFPAGAMSFKDKKGQIRDRPWTQGVVRLIRKAKVPVYPVFFDCKNSGFFYWLGKISWKIRTLRIPTEAFNKRGQTFDIHIGQPILPETLQQYPDDAALADFLYQVTYSASR